MFPPWLLRRVGELLPIPALHELFELSDMLERFSAGVWGEKKRVHAEGKVTNTIGQGRDVLSLLRA